MLLIFSLYGLYCCRPLATKSSKIEGEKYMSERSEDVDLREQSTREL